MSGRTRGLLGVVAVMVLLVGGWPALNAAIADERGTEAARDGRRVVLGPDEKPVRLTLGPGWRIDKPATSLKEGRHITLERDSLTLWVQAPLVLSDDVSARDLWSGLGDVLASQRRGAELGEPTPFRGDGLHGPAERGNEMGVATVLVSPHGGTAVQSTAVGKQPNDADLRAAEKVLMSAEFLEDDR